MPVQHVRLPGWIPTGALGTADGTHVSAHVTAIGFPPGVNVWLDLEGVDILTPTQAIMDYCNNWAGVISSAGCVPGLYVGVPSGLTGKQLGQLDFVHYWKSESGSTPTPTGFGFQMIQSHTTVDHGLQLDPDTTQNDQNGEAVFWLRVAS
jgi:hypothetical protein